MALVLHEKVLDFAFRIKQRWCKKISSKFNRFKAVMQYKESSRPSHRLYCQVHGPLKPKLQALFSRLMCQNKTTTTRFPYCSKQSTINIAMLNSSYRQIKKGRCEVKMYDFGGGSDYPYSRQLFRECTSTKARRSKA